MMTTQKQIREAFRADYTWLNYKKQKDGQYATDTRCAFCDYIEYLRRSGQISEALAHRATL